MNSPFLTQETLSSLIRIQERFQSMATPLLKNQMEYNLQVRRMVAPLIEMQKQSLSLNTVELQKFYARLNETLTPLRSSTFSNANLQNILKTQNYIISSLNNFNDSYLISDDSSQKFAEISENIIQEINSTELLDSPVEVPPSASSTNSKLTFQDVIAIIGIVLALLTYVQGFLPNEHEQKVERYLEQLIDLQTKELELLQQLSE